LSLRAAFPKLYEAEKAGGSVIRGGFKLAAGTGKKAAGRSRRRPGLLSFRQGNETLVKALANSLGTSLRCNAEIVEVHGSRPDFRLKVRAARGDEEISCSRLVIAVPTAAAANMLTRIVPAASNALRQIRYAAIAVVSLGYSIKQVGRSVDGFGFLVPRSAGVRTLGTVWNSSLFPGRVPPDHLLLTSFIGGATDPHGAWLRPEQLKDLVHQELSEVLRITGKPAEAKVTRYSDAIPQYNLGHLDLLRDVQASVCRVPGLYVIGNYWKGPAIGACLENALAVAEKIRIS
jgi:protoporphyrinogen/coproporphyrinogen III oxidase